MNKKYTYFCVLIFISLFFLFSNLLANNKSLSKFNLVYEGLLPVKNDEIIDCKVANLFGEQYDSLIVKSYTYFEIYSFQSNNWIKTNKIIFLNKKSDVNNRNIPWTIGDLNKNGKDEIIVCIDKIIKKYEWDENRFKETIYKSNYYTDFILTGDINNDAIDELVLFCYEKILEKDDTGCKYFLCIARFDKDNINNIWMDKGNLGFYKSELIPSDSLICIADIGNVGRNQLLIADGQSDVSLTKYNLLIWDNDRMKFVEPFFIIKGSKVKNDIPFSETFLIGDIIPIKIRGETSFLGVYNSFGFEEILFKIKNNKFNIIEKIFKHDEGWSLPEMVCYMDIDGKGKGILRIMQVIIDKKDIIKYKFYRTINF